MKPLITTRDLYEAAANRTPIYVYFDDVVYGPAPIEELTDFHVKLRIDSVLNNFVRANCSFYCAKGML
ncbi:hypothetical protein [Cohnella mopanensis]|uniref:hypothetical protein n=1 Tax=Cohnella mopanensis TaxID=2911966 RepID=UPI001EF77178|nr:hypothetical protein [Cohnella mopanensis]